MSGFVEAVVDRAPQDSLALVELARDGSRREWSFGEVGAASRALAQQLSARGIGCGDVVMTLIGNRPEWVLSMLACFRLGAIVLPCTEQSRAKDLKMRLSIAQPALVIADERNIGELTAAGPQCSVLSIPDESLLRVDPEQARPATAALSAKTSRVKGADQPALITFTSGTAGEPKAVVHAQRYLFGQQLQAGHWLAPARGELVWCTAAAGWSKSARNVFIAPWLRGAAALLHDARFDPEERLELIARERVNVLCMAPTEYRVLVKRCHPQPLPQLRHAVAAGEALNPEVLDAWREATGLTIHDGYGQTETGQITAAVPGEEPRPGSMGRPMPGLKAWVEDSELCVQPQSIPTFFLGYLGEDLAADRDRPGGWQINDRHKQEIWRTGDRVHEDSDGYLYFEGRNDDVIISSGYRIGPFEVESALVSHPAVAEAAAVAAPDDERGSVVRAVVVLRAGHQPSEALAVQLQEHVKHETAPYKYPRIIEFASELPKTASGKIRRAQLRQQ